MQTAEQILNEINRRITILETNHAKTLTKGQQIELATLRELRDFIES